MSIRSDGKKAVTHIKELVSEGKKVLIACRLETGRTHQIRVHLSSFGHAVLGDPLYSQGDWAQGPMHLHAAFLRFVPPGGTEEVTVFCPPPQEFTMREHCDQVKMDPWEK
jgi:23S rRNA pseudouridine1911/1915/1917 synthase